MALQSSWCTFCVMHALDFSNICIKLYAETVWTSVAHISTWCSVPFCAKKLSVWSRHKSDQDYKRAGPAEWHSGLEVSLQTRVRSWAVSQQAWIGCSIGRCTIGPASFGRVSSYVATAMNVSVSRWSPETSLARYNSDDGPEWRHGKQHRSMQTTSLHVTVSICSF